MHRIKKYNNHTIPGFTLIEVIVSLLIIGVMATIAGMGLTTGVRGYIFTKENAHMSQKAQLAMTRLSRELMELVDIVTPASDAIIYERTSGNRSFAMVGSTIKIRKGSSLPDAGNGDILIDNVSSLTLTYYKGAQEWQSGTDALQRLSTIKIDLVLNRADSGIGNITFSTTAHMRNTNNLGGAAETTDPPTASEYGCFVSSLSEKKKHASQAAILVLLIFLPITLKCFGKRHVFGQRGSIIIPLVATMVVLSALGAIMLPVTSTSTFTEIGANSALRSYLLGEAGYRYATSEYLNAANEDARDAVLTAIDNQTYTLAGNDGQFSIAVDTYWYKTTVDPAGSRHMDVTVPGGFPSDWNLDNGYLNINGTVYEYKNASMRAPSNVTFQKRSGNWPSIPAGTRITNVARSDNQVQTVTLGGDLELRRNDRGLNTFPRRNGQFVFDGNTYNYKELDLDNKLLRGITDPDDPSMPDFNVPANSWIELEKFIKITSTGTIAAGGGMETSREISYFAPLGWLSRASDSGGEIEVTDSFDDTSQWKASTLGAHAIAVEDGSNALDVTGSSMLGASLIALDWANTDADLATAWDSAGKFLDYTIQTKMKVDGQTVYMGGLCFRLDTATSSTYGVSFLHSAASGFASLFDGIPDSIVPIADQSMVVLWEQTNILTRKWLAYKTLSASDHIDSSTFFSDDMESGGGNWSAQNPWALITSDSHSPDTCWTDSPEGNYRNWTWKELVLDEQNLSGLSGATLSFWHRGITADSGDKCRVQIRYRNGGSWSFWATLGTYSGNFNTWRQETFDISSYIASQVQIRFRISTNFSGTADGWYVDDVVISSSGINWPTLVVRVDELTADSGTFTGQKVNDIQVFIGDTSAHGTAGTDPLDNNRLANPRDTINWPPDDVADTDGSNDYYTLVQWDANIDASVERLGTGSELNTIIRSNSLTTPATGSFTQDEIALHTWGWTGTSIFFDDFAINLATGGSSAVGYLNVIQE